MPLCCISTSMQSSWLPICKAIQSLSPLHVILSLHCNVTSPVSLAVTPLLIFGESFTSLDASLGSLLLGIIAHLRFPFHRFGLVFQVEKPFGFCPPMRCEHHST